MIQWQDLHHSELTVQTLYALLKLRCEVFVVEQTCPYQDIDGDDHAGENRHILGWRDNELGGVCEDSESEDDFEPVVIGRVIISSKARGEKLGYQLMEKRCGGMPKAVARQGVIPWCAGAPSDLSTPRLYAGHGRGATKTAFPHIIVWRGK